MIKNSLGSSIDSVGIILTLIAVITVSFSARAQNASSVPDPAASPADPAVKAPSPTPYPRVQIDYGKQALSRLAEEVPEDQLLWLEGGNGKFMAIWEPDKTGTPFGAALLLHGEGQSAESPHTVRALRDNLSHHGWGTLAISLPAAEANKIPPRQAKASKPALEKPGNATTSIEDDPETISDSHIRAGLAFLNQQGQYNIVIVGHGLGAVRAARFINSLSSPKKSSASGTDKIQRPVRAFVMVQARNRVHATGDNLTSFLNDPTLPILDIYYGDHFLDNVDVKARKKIARDKRIKSYFQVKILRPATSDDTSGNRLTRRVRGFLGQHAKGVAIERRRSGS